MASDIVAIMCLQLAQNGKEHCLFFPSYMLKGCCVLNIVKVSQFAIHTYTNSMERFFPNLKFERAKTLKHETKMKTKMGRN